MIQLKNDCNLTRVLSGISRQGKTLSANDYKSP